MFKLYIFLVVITNSASFVRSTARATGSKPVTNEISSSVLPSICLKTESAVISEAATSDCRNTLCPPVVTVADSEHLLINWAKSFKGCNKVQKATLQYKDHTSEVKSVELNFANKQARLETDPCYAHYDIKVIVEFKLPTAISARSSWSHPSKYNDYGVNPDIEELYSGLLRNLIKGKLCDRSVNNFPLSDIPDAVKACFKSDPTITRSNNGRDVTLSVTIKNHLESFPGCETCFALSLGFILCIYSS